MNSFLFLLTLLFGCAHIICLANDFYDVLGVDSSACEADIKKSYRNLAKQWHPDRHGDEKQKEKAEQKFMKISEAYETLSDPEKRRVYDQTGGQDPFGSARGGGRSSFQFKQGGHGGFGFNNFGGFSGFNNFGGRGGSNRQGFANQHQRRRGHQSHQKKQESLLDNVFKFTDVKILRGSDIKNTLDDSFRGNNIWIVFLSLSAGDDKHVVPIRRAILSHTEKFKSALHFAAVDCVMQDAETQQFCGKFIPARRSPNLVGYIKVFSPYEELNSNAVRIESPTAVSAVLKEVVNGLPKVSWFRASSLIRETSGTNSDSSASASLQKAILSKVRSCLKGKNAPLGCVFLFSDKMSSQEKISWKVKMMKHRLNGRADVSIIHIDSDQRVAFDVLNQFSTSSAWAGQLSLPVVAVYKNTALNKAEIRLSNFEMQPLDGNSYTYLNDVFTKEIWRKQEL